MTLPRKASLYFKITYYEISYESIYIYESLVKVAAAGAKKGQRRVIQINKSGQLTRPGSTSGFFPLRSVRQGCKSW